MVFFFIKIKKIFVLTDKKKGCYQLSVDSPKRTIGPSEPRLRNMLVLSFALHCVVLAIFIFMQGLQNRLSLNPIAHTTMVSLLNLNDLTGSGDGKDISQPTPEQKKLKAKQIKPPEFTYKTVPSPSPPKNIVVHPLDSTTLANVAYRHVGLEAQNPPGPGEDNRPSSDFKNGEGRAADENNTSANGFDLEGEIGSGVSTGGLGGNKGGKVQEDYFTIVRLKIEEHKTYPRLASIRQICGTVIIHFIITPEGAVKEVDIVQSSGSSLLDQAGLQAVRGASPFPRPPVEIFNAAVSIEVPIVFELI